MPEQAVGLLTHAASPTRCFDDHRSMLSWSRRSCLIHPPPARYESLPYLMFCDIFGPYDDNATVGSAGISEGDILIRDRRHAYRPLVLCRHVANPTIHACVRRHAAGDRPKRWRKRALKYCSEQKRYSTATAERVSCGRRFSRSAAAPRSRPSPRPTSSTARAATCASGPTRSPSGRVWPDPGSAYCWSPASAPIWRSTRRL